MRGKGYGYQIMNALEEKARELNQSSISLHVFGHNTHSNESLSTSLSHVMDIIYGNELHRFI